MNAQKMAGKIVISKDILFREIEGEAVLLNIRTGVYFGMNPVGTGIWRIMEKKKNLEDVLESMLENFEIDRKTCEQDLAEFVGRLEKNDLVSIENG